MKSKEIDLKTNKGGNNSGEVMFVRGRSQNRFQNHNLQTTIINLPLKIKVSVEQGPSRDQE